MFTIKKKGVMIMYARVDKDGELSQYGDDLWYYPETMAKRGRYYFFELPPLEIKK